RWWRSAASHWRPPRRSFAQGPPASRSSTISSPVAIPFPPFGRTSPASRYNPAAIVTEASKGDHWFRLQGPIFATVVMVSIVAGGTLGYMVIEGWSAWDAFYMTVITITTVGYREVHQLSRAGEVFTVLLLLG